MARVNIGVNPYYLVDQHLIAEHVEITMITGSLQKNNFIIKSNIPEIFCLGPGHINFFKNKLVYLDKRLEEVKKEMIRRNMKVSCKIILDNFPDIYKKDWKPSIKDTKIIRERITWKILRKNDYWKYNKKIIKDLNRYCMWFNESCLFYV